MDVIYRQGSVTNKIADSRSHRLSGWFAIFLTSIVALDIFLVDFMHIGRLSTGSILIAVFYKLQVDV